MSKRAYILYDGRAQANQGTEDAVILVACSSNKEARSYAGEYGDMACYSYREHGDWEEGDTLIDEQWEWDWCENGGFTP